MGQSPQEQFIRPVLIPFIAGVFLNRVNYGIGVDFMSLNPFYCRGVFECSSGDGLDFILSLNPFYCRGVFESESEAYKAAYRVLIPFIAGVFLNGIPI